MAAKNSTALADRVRSSTALTPELRRYWLKVLPFLTPAEVAKLESLLGEERLTADSAEPDAHRLRFR